MGREAGDNLTARRKRTSTAAVARRAALRRRALEESTIPETRGPESKTAGLVMFGMPGGAATKAARFGPKGFTLAKKGTESVGKYVMRVLKPVLGKSVKKPK